MLEVSDANQVRRDKVTCGFEQVYLGREKIIIIIIIFLQIYILSSFDWHQSFIHVVIIRLQRGSELGIDAIKKLTPQS